MDERLIEIFKLVFLLNKKGEDLQIILRENGIHLIDKNCESIIPSYPYEIYFNNFWKKDFEKLINGTLTMLKEMLEGAENE